MTTATVRALRYDFPKIMKSLKKGEEVEITFRGKPIGTIVPSERKSPKVVKWPNIMERLDKMHGKKMVNPVAALLKQREGEQ